MPETTTTPITNDKIEELANALNDTWNVIANDVANTGAPIKGKAAAEVCADYVYCYGDRGRETERSHALSKEIMALNAKDFLRVSRKAKLST